MEQWDSMVTRSRSEWDVIAHADSQLDFPNLCQNFLSIVARKKVLTIDISKRDKANERPLIVLTVKKSTCLPGCHYTKTCETKERYFEQKAITSSGDIQIFLCLRSRRHRHRQRFSPWVLLLPSPHSAPCLFWKLPWWWRR